MLVAGSVVFALIYAVGGILAHQRVGALMKWPALRRSRRPSSLSS